MSSMENTISNSVGSLGRALILDDHSYTAVQACRELAKSGYIVDAFADRSAPVLTSQYCHQKLISEPEDSVWIDLLRSVAASNSYDIIYLCSEHLQSKIAQYIHHFGPWSGLLLSEPSLLPALLSKNSVMRIVGDAGIPAPKTLFPTSANEIETLGPSLGFPLLVKGEGGESARTIRIVRSKDELMASYRSIVSKPNAAESLPCLQEFIDGPTYNVGGLFQNGEPIRICACRMDIMEPYKAGLMAKGVTERPPALIANALRVFKALRYTGFGDADFVLDRKDGQFKFLEINPEVWANLGLAEHAGVDFHGPYRALAHGESVWPDLTFREGVSFYRVSKRVLSTLKRPWLGVSLLRDFLDSSIRTDWDNTDLKPDLHLLINSVRRCSRALTETSSNHSGLDRLSKRHRKNFMPRGVQRPDSLSVYTDANLKGGHLRSLFRIFL